MAQAVFVNEGDFVDFAPGSAVAAGEVVVQGDLVGVVMRPLGAGELGSLAVLGVFDCAKATNVAYTVGTILFWDDVNNVVTSTSTGNKQIGKVVRAAATADPTVRIRLTQ